MATPASLIDMNAAAKALGMTVEDLKKRMVAAKAPVTAPVTATIVVGKDPTFDVDVKMMAQNVQALYDKEKQTKANFKIERSDITKLITEHWKKVGNMDDNTILKYLTDKKDEYDQIISDVRANALLLDSSMNMYIEKKKEDKKSGTAVTAVSTNKTDNGKAPMDAPKKGGRPIDWEKRKRKVEEEGLKHGKKITMLIEDIVEDNGSSSTAKKAKVGKPSSEMMQTTTMQKLMEEMIKKGKSLKKAAKEKKCKGGKGKKCKEESSSDDESSSESSSDDESGSESGSESDSESGSESDSESGSDESSD